MNEQDQAQRAAAYRQLVADVREKLMQEPAGMLGCPECNEINLWAYWQGGENHLDAKILLVGQDWGAIATPERQKWLSRIQVDADDCDYFGEDNNTFETDQNLITLFRSIGYDIETRKYPALFFTNYAIGYRGDRDTGTIPLKNWLKESEPYMRRLIEIVQPTVVLCLGKDVYQAVCALDSYHKAIRYKTWNSCIEAGGTQVSINEQVTVHAVPLAHPGFFGTSNRNRGQKVTSKLELQLQDWQRFAQTYQVANAIW